MYLIVFQGSNKTIKTFVSNIIQVHPSNVLKSVKTLRLCRMLNSDQFDTIFVAVGFFFPKKKLSNVQNASSPVLEKIKFMIVWKQ